MYRNLYLLTVYYTFQKYIIFSGMPRLNGHILPSYFVFSSSKTFHNFWIRYSITVIHEQ